MRPSGKASLRPRKIVAAVGAYRATCKNRVSYVLRNQTSKSILWWWIAMLELNQSLKFLGNSAVSCEGGVNRLLVGYTDDSRSRIKPTMNISKVL